MTSVRLRHQSVPGSIFGLRLLLVSSSLAPRLRFSLRFSGFFCLHEKQHSRFQLDQNIGAAWKLVKAEVASSPSSVIYFLKTDFCNTIQVINCKQGSYPFSKTNFQDFSRAQIDFSRALKFTLTPTLPRSQC